MCLELHPPKGQFIHLKDCVTNVSDSFHPHSLSNYISYDHLSSTYQAYLSGMYVDIEPNTYEEAVQDKRWIEAMKQEIAALESNGTWEIMSFPPGKKAIGCKWVFKIKYKANREVDRFKARLVAKVYNQTEGIDYQETFSRYVKMVTVRSIIDIAATENWQIFQMDAFNASLQGDLFEQVYMELPKGFTSQGEPKV